MTKTQVKNKINKLIKDYNKMLESEVDKVLHEADMWYGDDEGAAIEEAKRWIMNKKNLDDRNADQLVHDGMFETSCRISDFLHTRKELGI